MPHWRKLPGMSGKVVGVADVPADREVTFRIRDVGAEKFERDDKGVIYIDGTDKYLPLNKTNGGRITAMFGPFTEAWVGKRITVAVDPSITFGSERTGGVVVVGSPDIERDVQVSVKINRKQRRTETLRRTTPSAAPPTDDREPERVPVASDGHQLGD
jgi:hypothetical protein